MLASKCSGIGDGLHSLRSGFDSYSHSSGFFSVKNWRDLPFHEDFPAEQKCQKNLEILSKCSVEAIQNTTLCKLNKVSKGFRPMGPNADLTPEAETS